jgi:hypothetical protein
MATIAIPNAAKADIKLSLEKIGRKLPAITRYTNYYDGQHEFNFSSEKFATQFARRLRTMRDNLCKTCVKAPSDRLEILGFSSDKKSTVYNESWEIWKRSQMPRLAKRVHRDAFKTGDAFVQVWKGKDGFARIVPQDPKTITVFYDTETQEIVKAAKIWKGDDDYIYLTLFYPDRIEKYISNRPAREGAAPTTAAAFTVRPVDAEPWPLPNPLGIVPVFHFGLEGSILDDVIPLNDALNKEMADMLVGSEANSLRQRWTTGITYEINSETGQKIIPFERASQWFTANDTNAKFGEFADVTLSEFLAVINDFRNEIANVAGIPQYYFRLGTGDFPSGEALTKAESRFSSLIADAQLDFGETWAAAVKLAMVIDGKQTGDQGFETQWKSPSPASDNEKLDQGLKKKQLGVSDERNLSEIGYSDADIELMKQQTAEQRTAAGAAFATVFDAGSAAVS